MGERSGRRSRGVLRRATGGVLLAGLMGAGVAEGQAPSPSPQGAATGAVPRATCGAGSRPELGLQGQVRGVDYASGYADTPITCNTELIGHIGTTSGFKVERYVDPAGHECAYYDSTRLFPVDAADAIGTFVVDMADPSRPRVTTTLVTAAMLTPHESLLVNQRRGLLAAVAGNVTTYPGVIDLYDLRADCRAPQLRSSSPTGILGHESGWSSDGNTFYASSLGTGHTTAVDVSNPSLPVTLYTGDYSSHGLSLNADGTRAYLAARDGAGSGENPAGLIIIDTSEIQSRQPLPDAPVVSTLTWPSVSIPQNAMPMTIGGRPYLLEIDEFAGGPIPSGEPDANVGTARIIDISDERNPVVVSELRLEVQTPAGRVASIDDPGADAFIGGYSGHYCGVPREVEPGIVACSMILSGLRVFDVRDPLRPREIAYFNSPGLPSRGDPGERANALSRPTFAPERDEIWYADTGLFVVRLTGEAATVLTPTPPEVPAPAAVATVPSSSEAGGALAATGDAVPVGIGIAMLALAVVARRFRCRAA